MAQILHSEVIFLLSTISGSAGFTNPGTPGSSNGRFLSTTVLSSTTLDNLFTDITAAQNTASQVDYQCLFVLNSTVSGNNMQNTIAWLPASQQTPYAATFQLASDNIGIVPQGQVTPQAAQISSHTVAPSGVSAFINPSNTNAGGLSIGSVAPGNCFALWIKRSAHNTAPLTDQLIVEIDYVSFK